MAQWITSISWVQSSVFQASEVVFNFLSRRNLVPVIPYGDALLFSVGMAGHCFLLKWVFLVNIPIYSLTRWSFCFLSWIAWWGNCAKNFINFFLLQCSHLSSCRRTSSDLSRKDPISSALKFFIGEDEFISTGPSNFRRSNSQILIRGVRKSVNAFLVGYLGRCLISTVTSLPKIISNPSESMGLLRQIFTSEKHLKQGLFLGATVATFRLVRYILRENGVDDRLSRAVAGAAAGSWIAVSRNTSLTLYLFWKAVEVSWIQLLIPPICCCCSYVWWLHRCFRPFRIVNIHSNDPQNYIALGMKQGVVPRVPYSTEIVYALSTALVLFNAVMEPLNIRPSYIRFLNDITGTA